MQPVMQLLGILESSPRCNSAVGFKVLKKDLPLLPYSKERALTTSSLFQGFKPKACQQDTVVSVVK